MKNRLLLILFSLSPLMASAGDIEKTLAKKYFTIKNVEVIEIEEGPELIDPYNKSFNKERDDNELIIETTEPEVSEAETDDKEEGLVELIGDGIDGMMLYGRRIWNIITSGKPTNQASHITPLSVIPNVNGQPSTLYDMENWELPKRKKFKVNYKNLLGMSVVSFTYSVNYQAGGSYNGKGQWLTGINVDASEVSVMWGFGFNATSSLVGVTNMGTKEEPIAAATLKVSWELTSVLQSVKGSESFHITGDNRLIPVTE